MKARYMLAALVAAGLAPAASAQEVIRMQVAAGHPAIFLWVKHVNESLMATVDAELKKTGKYRIQWNESYGGTLAKIGSELEFVLFRESYDSAREKGYRGLKPANAYNVDYSVLGTTMVEDVIRPIRLAMKQAGLAVEDSKGECNLGQHEINFRYRDALGMADDHVDRKSTRLNSSH